MMVYHPVMEQKCPQFVAASSLKIKAIDAKKIAGVVHMDTIAVSEISDTELLQMALEFENKHKK
jgi:hypothetical protein